MKVLMLYHGGEFPPAERIEKEAASLHSAGHETALFCNNYGKFSRSAERVGPVEVHRLVPTFANRLLNRVLKFPIFFNPLWVLQGVVVARRVRPDVVQVVDIPLAPLALFLGRLRRIPVVIDMWENYPEALKGWGSVDWKTRIFKNYRVARWVELFATRRADHIVVVADEQKERLIEDGVAPERISVVTNAVDLKTFVVDPAVQFPADLFNSPLNLIYVGGLTIERGLHDIVRAMPLLKARGVAAKFVIVGSGNVEAQLKALADELKVSDRVAFVPWIKFEEVAAYIARADIGVVPHVNNGFINTTMPNKIFQYMALSKPVLVSHAKPLARVVHECQCGEVFTSGSPEDAAEKIARLADAKRRHSYGVAGAEAVRTKYHWDAAAGCYVEALARISQMS